MKKLKNNGLLGIMFVVLGIVMIVALIFGGYKIKRVRYNQIIDERLEHHGLIGGEDNE